jgi:hypothetical protein
MTEKLIYVRQLARGLMDAHGLSSWTFRYNGRRRQIACCVAPGHGQPGRIELSRHFLPILDPATLRDTLLHEVAHALVGPEHGHDDVWKRKCLEIGARPEPCGRPPSMPRGVWRASCPSCRRSYDFYRRPKTLRRYCAACGPERGAMTLSRVGD